MKTTIDTESLKARIDLRELAGKRTTLRKHTQKELCGPCPVCGGDDRFYVSRDVWGCRNCKTGGDAIGYVMWLEKVDFMEAVKMLDANAVPTVTAPPVSVRKHETPTWNAADVAARLATYQKAMDASPAADYLAGRGFTPDTWRAYGMGYRKDWHALAIPWFRGGTLWAINYRKLEPEEKGKRFVSEPGGLRSNVLFGGHTLIPNLHHLLPNGVDPLAKRSIILVEGELNAASIWQAVYPLVDVLSFGAEGNGIPPAFAPIAMRYRCCVIWKDKEALAREAARQVPGAAATWSERGDKKTDANDMLQAQTLRKYLGALLRAATPKQHSEALAYDLKDAGLA